PRSLNVGAKNSLKIWECGPEGVACNAREPASDSRPEKSRTRTRSRTRTIKEGTRNLNLQSVDRAAAFVRVLHGALFHRIPTDRAFAYWELFRGTTSRNRAPGK